MKTKNEIKIDIEEYEDIEHLRDICKELYYALCNTDVMVEAMYNSDSDTSDMLFIVKDYCANRHKYISTDGLNLFVKATT
jgi:hypothetical protein